MTAELAAARLPTSAGDFRLHLFAGEGPNRENVALVHGEVGGREGVLVRVHSECFTGEVLGSLRCDCGPQLVEALRQIAGEGAGVLVYLRQEGRGIGLAEKLRAYNLQDAGHDTVDANLMLGHGADDREYSVAADILRNLGVASVRLLTNNPAKIEDLGRHGVEVAARVPTLLHLNAENAPYLAAKARRMRHLLRLEPAAAARVGAELVESVLPAPAEPLDGLADLRRRIAAHGAGAGRPFVTLSYAQSVDGCIAATPDRPLALSGEASLTLTHRLRALHDAILVGVGTVVADDPRLTVRRVPGRHPRPVVVDGRLETPLAASLLQGSNGSAPLIATAEDACRERQRRLEAAGAEVVRLPADACRRVSLPALLAHLVATGTRSLMVEGGARIITSFLAERLVDHLVLTVAPLFVAGLRGVCDLGGSGLPRLRNLEYRQLGDDLVVRGDPTWEEA